MSERLDVRRMLLRRGWTEGTDGCLRKNGALWAAHNTAGDSGLDATGARGHHSQRWNITFDAGVPARIITATCEAAAAPEPHAQHQTPAPDTDFQVLPGQVYVPCAVYNWAPRSTFIIRTVDTTDVEVVIPFGGGKFHPNGRRRRVSRTSLHPTSKTATGRDRKTGWYLYTPAPAEPGLWLCGNCWRYYHRAELAVVSYGPASSTCHPCNAAIKARYANPDHPKD